MKTLQLLIVVIALFFSCKEPADREEKRAAFEKDLMVRLDTLMDWGGESLPNEKLRNKYKLEYLTHLECLKIDVYLAESQDIAYKLRSVLVFYNLDAGITGFIPNVNRDKEAYDNWSETENLIELVERFSLKNFSDLESYINSVNLNLEENEYCKEDFYFIYLLFYNLVWGNHISRSKPISSEPSFFIQRYRGFEWDSLDLDYPFGVNLFYVDSAKFMYNDIFLQKCHLNLEVVDFVKSLIEGEDGLVFCNAYNLETFYLYKEEFIPVSHDSLFRIKYYRFTDWH